MLISICIPTKNRTYILRETLHSIFNSTVDNSLYEIIISDNSDDNSTLNLSNEFKGKGMNVIYYKNNEKGFYNSIKSLQLGSGDFLKLHNDYTKFKPGCFEEMISLVCDNFKIKSQILFTDGNLKINNIQHLDDFDSFIACSSYWNTWSSAFSIWRDDLHRLSTNKSDLNDQFPHTSLLFQNSKKTHYIIDDRILYENSKVEKKGGYNIFYNFCVLYIEMLHNLLKRGVISKKTLNHIKRKLKYQFISTWYCNSLMSKGEFSFDNTDYVNNILTYYSRVDFFVIFFVASLRKFWRILRQAR